MKEIDHLKKMFSRETLNKMGGEQKRAYKYCLCAISINIIRGYRSDQEFRLQLDHINLAREIKKHYKEINFFELNKSISQKINTSLESNCFKKPYDKDFLDKFIQFNRKRLEDLKKDQSLFQARELTDLLDIEKFFNPHPVSENSWLDFTLYSGIIWTIPEMIIFSDFKVQWNEYIELRKRDSEGNDWNDPNSREFGYKKSALQRILIFLCVSFVEAYLYNLFYNIKHKESLQKDEIKSILNNNTFAITPLQTGALTRPN